MKDLIKIYKESESPLEKANLWSHILEKIEEKCIIHNSDNYSGSLYFDEDEAINLNNEREAYKRGYIQAINDLIF